MADRLKLAVIYNSELLQYCVYMAFIVTSVLADWFRYFLFVLCLFNDAYINLHYITWNDNE
jgi:hypothetical protein